MDKFSEDFDLAVAAIPIRRQIEEKLRKAIVSGKFAPGMHLSDKLLCDAFRASRPMVREAVRQLAAEGLVETIPHRGSFVKKYSSEEAAHIFAVREVLEALAARNFAERATPAELAELEGTYEEMLDALRQMPRKEISEIKLRYYEILLRGAGNPHTAEVVSVLLNRNMLLRRTTLADPSRLAKSVAEIGVLMDALRRRDPEAAWKASVQHLQNAAATAIGILRRQEEAEKLAESQPAKPLHRAVREDAL